MKFDSFLEKIREHNRCMDGHCLRLIGLNERLEKTLERVVKILEKQVTEDGGETCRGLR